MDSLQTYKNFSLANRINYLTEMVNTNSAPPTNVRKISLIKKVLLAAPLFLLWIFYLFITIREREEYLISKEKGYKCTGSTDHYLAGQRTATTYQFDPTQKPEKQFGTWKQFWTSFGY